MNLNKKIVAYYTAAKAGWIAHRCTECVVDDENEEIRACWLHEAEIARLEKINAENQ